MPPSSFLVKNNPFVLRPEIPDKFFCDRKNETDTLIDLLKNGNNVVLKAERRVGKSSLIHHVLGDPRITGVFKTYFIDIFNTENEAQFASCLANGLFKGNVEVPFREKLSTIASLFGIELGIDELSGLPKAKFAFNKPSGGNLKRGIDEMFDLLENEKSPAIVVFDEFQQIQTYPEKRLAALLRTRVQMLPHVGFVFSGSDRRMLDFMFNTSTEPFFRSCTDMELLKIPKDAYVSFSKRMFENSGRTVEVDAVNNLYDLLYGYTSFLHTVLNHAFMNTPKGKHCDRDVIIDSLAGCLHSKDIDFHKMYFDFSVPSRNFLKGIAFSRGTASIYSSDFLKMNSLDVSECQTAAKTLIGRGLEDRHVVRDPRTGIYSLDNKFFEIWIRNFKGQSLSEQLRLASDFARRDPREGLRKDFPDLSLLTLEERTQFEKFGKVLHPFNTESIDRTPVSYLVAKGNDGTPWALPVEDCMALMSGIESVPIKKGVVHSLTPQDKSILSSGSILEIEGKKFHFDLNSMQIKRYYVTKKRIGLKR